MLYHRANNEKSNKTGMELELPRIQTFDKYDNDICYVFRIC